MKLLYLFVSLLFTISVNAGKITGPAGVAANAGPDQTIYLTQTSSVTLNGSASSAGSYQWTEVSTDYSSGATITSPNSAVTTVTGLKQGVWYFQLSVTSNGITATDQVVVRVDYDLPPSNGTLIHTFKMDDNSSVINDRHDTSSYFPVSDLNFGQSGADPNHFFLFRDRLNGLGIDKENGKLYSTIQDGYAGTDGFPRSEVALADYDFTIDTLHTYTFEWKGYFPQNENYLTSWYQILTMFQIHGGVQVPTVFGFDLDANGNLISGDVYDDYSGTDYGKGPGLKTVSKNFSTLNNFFDNAHTIRVTVREGRGYAGQTAFIKIELDGVTTYYRNTGQVGSSHWDDYVKFGGLYDWNSAMVNGNDLWRGRKFQLVTEAFNVYVLTDNQSPTASAGNNQTITLPNNTVALSGSASDPDGTVSWYEWTQLSGPTGATINNPTSSTTSVDGLSEGVYQFELKVQDNQGATATSTTQVTVNAAANSIPTVNAGADQIITLPDDGVTLYGSANDSDGFISSWLWKKISGPAVTVSDSSAASTSITGLVQGTYAFELTVNDNSGAVARDMVIVKVNPAPIMTNKSPTANAGGDKTITLPTNSTELSGNGTDSDGTIVSYLWKNISSLSAAISDSSAAITQVKNLLAGSYQFELTVTDNKGATGKDTVMITVKADSSIKIDKSPVANAGSDQTITLPTDSVKLSGSGNDSDGTIASYSWSQISGNASTIVNGSSATTTVRNLAQGAYQFELTVTDDKGATGKDTMKVAVIAAHKTSTNKAPVANAGSDQTITLPTDSVKLSGSGNDSDGTIASYSWSQISGNASTIVNGSSATTTVGNLAQGAYQFELTVTDDKGATGKDTVKVAVIAAQKTSTNKSPVANAGSDQTITLPTDSVKLSGSGNDSDGTIASYSWSQISGNASTIVNGSSATTTVGNLTQGAYQFELTVTDDKGATGKDTVKVAVIVAQKTSTNKSPVANAGLDQTITLPTNTVQLLGSGTDVDGTIANYNWVKISGPSTFSLINSSSGTAEVNNLVKGVYQFELTVKDDKGAIGKDTVKVSVIAAPTTSVTNITPIANAGANQTITLPQDSATLTGSGTDKDGTVTSYSWSKISGPASYLIRNAQSAITKISNLEQGEYQFELKVTDDKRSSSVDTVQITVNAAKVVVNPNTAPVANAGTDVTVTSTQGSVTLTGSGTDKDGQIKAYHWQQLSGPSLVTIDNENAASISINNLTAGTYEFEFTVMDNEGAIGKDTVKVTVALTRMAPQSGKLNVYPNPVHDIANLTVVAPEANTHVSIVVTDMSGKAVYKKEFVSESVHVIQQIDMSNLIKGIYVLSVYFDGMQQQSVKVVRL